MENNKEDLQSRQQLHIGGGGGVLFFPLKLLAFSLYLWMVRWIVSNWQYRKQTNKKSNSRGPMHKAHSHTMNHHVLKQ